MARGQPRLMQRLLEVWAAQHLRALIGALGRLWRDPVPSMMTAGVIAISLALPTAFMLLLGNVDQAVGRWDGGVRLSLFLQIDAPAEGYRRLATELEGHPQVAETRIITPEQARAEFEQTTGFQEAMELLGENPLPPVVVVRPRTGLAPAVVDALVGELRQRPLVEEVRLDREWLQRLYAFMRLAERGVQVIAVLLAVAVLLVVGNTIRLAIENRRDEIQITKLIGATDGFVRRPFLYEGLWYGLLGSLLAWLLLGLGHWLLSAPAEHLAGLYDSGLQLRGLAFSQGLLLLVTGVCLGLLGSWIAVGRHLSAIEPHQ